MSIKILKVISILIVLFSLTTLRSFSNYEFILSDWIYTQFFFNYEYEYVKRGLIGELIRLFFKMPSMSLVISISIIPIFLIIIFSVFIFYKIYKINEIKNFWILIASLILCSATYQHINFDIGRFDTFLILIFIFSILVIEIKNKYLSLFLIIVFQTIGIMIHDIYILSFSPLIIFIWYYRHKESLYIYILLYFIIILIIGIFLFYFGKSTELDFETRYKILLSYYPNISSSSLNVLYRSISESIFNTFATSISFRRLYDHIAMFIGLSGFFILYFKIIKNFLKNKKYQFLVLFLLCLTPLSIYPLSHDHFRWWHLFFVNFNILIVYLIIKKDNEFISTLNGIFENKFFKKFYIFGIFLCILLGPLGSTHSYFILYRIKNYLLNFI